MKRLQWLVVALLACPHSAWAGPYSDDLAKCLVSSTTEADRVALARWMFAAFAAHPAVAPLSAATNAQIEAVNAEGGRLFTRLLTDSCRDKTVDAVRYEGSVAVQQGFQVLGQVAGMELAANPAVQARIAGLMTAVDVEKLKALGKAVAEKSAR